MIQIKDVKRVEVGDPPETKVVIRYFAGIEDERFFTQVQVDDFPIETSTLEDVKAIIEQASDETELMNMYKRRKESAANTYQHDGNTFSQNLKFVDWSEEGVGASYEKNDIAEFNGTLYRCVQAHTVDDISWTPEATAALWSPILVFGNEYRPWQQPQGAHDAYPEGAIVRHNASMYKSLVADNVWEPGTDATLWVEIDSNTLQPIVTEPAPNTGTTPEWDGNSVSYAIGDEVMYNGTKYTCIQAHTSQAGWDPVSASSLWDVVA